MEWGNLFDTYAWRAWVMPALLCLIPPAVTASTLKPMLYSHGAQLLGLGVGAVVLYLLTHLARARGRAAEKRFYAEWGGKPTTAWLRYRDHNLETVTKTRYYAFFAEHIPKWRAPSRAMEEREPEAADGRYESCVRWLLEQTRDRRSFPLVFKENASYGFRRNLYGLKPYGLTLALVCSMINLTNYLDYIHGFDRVLDDRVLVPLTFSLAASLAWTLVIRPTWVQDAANAYARALLASCDVIGRRQQGTSNSSS